MAEDKTYEALTCLQNLCLFTWQMKLKDQSVIGNELFIHSEMTKDPTIAAQVIKLRKILNVCNEFLGGMCYMFKAPMFMFIAYAKKIFSNLTEYY